MEILLFDRNVDRSVIERVFPAEIRQRSSAFLGAFNENGDLCGLAALGYERDTLLLQYLFVPEKYRSKGVATALLDDISERLEGKLNGFMEAYFDEQDDIDGLRGLFSKRPDYHMENRDRYAAVYWLGLSSSTLVGAR